MARLPGPRSVQFTVALVSLCGACSSAERETPTMATIPSTITSTPVASIRVDWDNHCETSWRLSYDGRSWKSSAATEEIGSEHTGSVEAVTDDTLKFRLDSGVLLVFVIDDASETVCS
jgi:hypothetical protein